VKQYEFRVGGPRNGQGVGLWIKDIAEGQRKFKKEISRTARDNARKVVVAARLDATVKQQPAVARSLTVDLFKGKPAVNMGGRKVAIRRNGKKRPALAGEIAAGAEFGSNGGKHSGHMTRHKNFFERSFVHHNKRGSVKQFPPRSRKLGRGSEGYFFYPNVHKFYQQILNDYQNSLSEIFK
jgi:hypothetical protein